MDGAAGYVELRWSGEDGDGTGKLRVTAEANGFRGDGGAWFDRTSVLAFAERIAGFPVDEAEPPILEGGYDELEGDDLHVGLTLYPLGSSGQVGFAVDLAGDPSLLTRFDRYRARLEVPVTYEGLRTFARDLVHLLDRTIDVARIDGDRLL